MAWAISPASGGTITSTGGFTASSTPGTYTILVDLAQNPSVSASTTLVILPLPALSGISSDLDQAEGTAQTAQGGFLNNSPVAGEAEQTTVSSSPSGFISSRSGFLPPVQSAPAGSAPAPKKTPGKNP